MVQRVRTIALVLCYGFERVDFSGLPQCDAGHFDLTFAWVLRQGLSPAFAVLGASPLRWLSHGGSCPTIAFEGSSSRTCK